MGFETYKKHCAFDTILLREDGLAVIDPEKCSGCSKCAEVCPKGVIRMVKPQAPVLVNCNSKNKGAEEKSALPVVWAVVFVLRIVPMAPFKWWRICLSSMRAFV